MGNAILSFLLANKGIIFTVVSGIVTRSIEKSKIKAHYKRIIQGVIKDLTEKSNKQ